MLHLLRFMRKGVYELLMLEEQDINYPASIARNKRIRMIYVCNESKEATDTVVYPIKEGCQDVFYGFKNPTCQ